MRTHAWWVALRPVLSPPPSVGSQFPRWVHLSWFGSPGQSIFFSFSIYISEISKRGCVVGGSATGPPLGLGLEFTQPESSGVQGGEGVLGSTCGLGTGGAEGGSGDPDAPRGHSRGLLHPSISLHGLFAMRPSWGRGRMGQPPPVSDTSVPSPCRVRQ